MTLERIGLEIKKLLLNKTLYFFIGACFIFNFALIVITSGEHTYVGYIGDVIDSAGNQVNTLFLEYLAAQPETKLRDRLTLSCKGMEKVYDSFDATALGEWYYQKYYVQTSYLARLLFEKYEKLASSVQVLNLGNDDLSIYSADATNRVHEVVFTYVLKALMIEGFMLISFLAVYIMGMERQNSTEAVVYCSHRGRALVKDKMFAAGIISACSIFVLYTVTLALLFFVWDFSGIWKTNVSSGFHYVEDENLPFAKPFLTWKSFTVKEYFVASLLLVMILFVIWWLISSSISILIRQSAKGILTAAACLIAPYFLSILFTRLQLWWLFYLNTFSLSILTLNQHLWFTEMGIYELLPWQEIMSCVIHSFISVFLFIAAVKVFKGREIK